MQALRRFVSDRQGGTAAIFAVALLPLLACVGAAVDYARAENARARLQNALDATAVALVRDAGRMNDRQLEDRAKAFLAGMFRSEAGVAARDVAVSRDGQVIRVQAEATVPTTIMRLVGRGGVEVGGEARATAGNRTIELALVIDNTGSMAQDNRLGLVREAAKFLINELDRAAAGGDRVSVSVVPFDTQVRLKTANANAPWLRPLRADEVSSPCGPIRISPATGLLPATAPDPDRAARNAWTGYVTDRDRVDCDPGLPARIVDMNVAGAAADSLKDETLYPMVPNERGESLPEILPLTRNLGQGSDVRKTLNDMRPRGCTNITLGTMWGLETLSPGAPFTEGSAFGTPNVDKIMIILTDGQNTRDAFTNRCDNEKIGTQAELDDRTMAACTAAKASGVTVFTIKVVEGSDRLLGGCASRVTDPRNAFYRGPDKPELYFPAQDVSQISGVFRQIASIILQTRLTQ